MGKKCKRAKEDRRGKLAKGYGRPEPKPQPRSIPHSNSALLLHQVTFLFSLKKNIRREIGAETLWKFQPRIALSF
jgi:hypothetical protein